MRQGTAKSNDTRRDDVAVVVTTYEAPELLRFSLLALARQTIVVGTVLVADDGSSDRTVEMLADLAPNLPFSLVHIWQPHDGFRAARSRNNAIYHARESVLCFLDQDILAHSTWLENHLAHLRSNTVCLGIALNMPQEKAATLEQLQIETGEFERWHTPNELKTLAARQRKYSFYTVLRRLGLGIKSKPSLRSGNFAAWRADLLRVNGFDEDYIGWGQEDDDLGRRLYMAGVRPVPILDRALATHIPHPPRHPTWKNGANVQLFHRQPQGFRCAKGLDAHPHPDVCITRVDPTRRRVKETSAY
ncbi:MAG: glycosyltransferase [Kiritimatiellia bacterium]